jgi:hypothetical protein
MKTLQCNDSSAITAHAPSTRPDDDFSALMLFIGFRGQPHMATRDRLLQGVQFEPLEGKPQKRGRKQRLFMHLNNLWNNTTLQKLQKLRKHELLWLEDD